VTTPKQTRHNRKTAQNDCKALRVTTQAGLAELFDVTPKTIWCWLRAGAPDKTGDGYDVAEWIRWYVHHLGVDAGGETLQQARTRRAIAQANMDEEKARREVGASITRQDHESALRRVCGAFAGAVNRAPAGLCAELAGLPIGDVRKRLDQWRFDTLNTFFGDGSKPVEDGDQ